MPNHPIWPSGYINVPDDEHCKLMNNGDEITITGVKRLNDGTIVENCKPGQETVWVVKKPTGGTNT